MCGLKLVVGALNSLGLDFASRKLTHVQSRPAWFQSLGPQIVMETSSGAAPQVPSMEISSSSPAAEMPRSSNLSSNEDQLRSSCFHKHLPTTLNSQYHQITTIRLIFLSRVVGGSRPSRPLRAWGRTGLCSFASGLALGACQAEPRRPCTGPYGLVALPFSGCISFSSDWLLEVSKIYKVLIINWVYDSLGCSCKGFCPRALSFPGHACPHCRACDARRTRQESLRLRSASFISSEDSQTHPVGSHSPQVHVCRPNFMMPRKSWHRGPS